jgi:hypothetical protein
MEMDSLKPSGFRKPLRGHLSSSLTTIASVIIVCVCQVPTIPDTGCDMRVKEIVNCHNLSLNPSRGEVEAGSLHSTSDTLTN